VLLNKEADKTLVNFTF